MKISKIAVFSAGIILSYSIQAAENIQNETVVEQVTPNEKIGPLVQNPDTNIPHKSEGILSKQGDWLAARGIQPTLGFTQMYFTNPNVGIETNKSEAVSIFTLGAHVDLEKLVGFKGANLHFEELYVPWIHNLDYGTQASSSIVGTLGPYIPQKTHLTLFTYEQKFLDNKATFEVGKSNAGNYFALPMCNSPITCVNASLQKVVGMNPPPYANWSARFAYDLNPKLRIQTGWWRSDAAFPFTDGWESNGGKFPGTMSNVYLANVAYKTDFKMEKYPSSWEVLGYHNDAIQQNPYLTVNHTSKVFDSESAVKTSSGVSGLYLSGKKTIWRADGGTTDSPFPKSLSVYANMTHAFNDDVTAGIQNQGSAGIILNHAFESRPFDSYSINFLWARLTDDEQRYLKDAHLAAGGKGYTVGQTETAIGLDANFILSKGVVLSPFAMYSWDSNTSLSPNTSVIPESGLSAGVVLHFQFDQILGLTK